MTGRFSNLKHLRLDPETESASEKGTQESDTTSPQPQPTLGAVEPAMESKRSTVAPSQPDEPHTQLTHDDPGAQSTSSGQQGRGAPPSTSAQASPPVRAPRPWEEATVPAEPQKALNGRVPRSVRLSFDRKLTDAMDTLRSDVTVDIAVEALARLVTEDEEVYERWIHKIWELKTH